MTNEPRIVELPKIYEAKEDYDPNKNVWAKCPEVFITYHSHIICECPNCLYTSAPLIYRCVLTDKWFKKDELVLKNQ